MNNNFFEELFEECEYVASPMMQQETWEEQKKNLRSDKNLQICKSHQLESERLTNLLKQYESLLQTLKNELEPKVVAEEYAAGGEVLHRGFYCPSPIVDIVIGGANRGRLLNRMTQKSKPTYKYKFDAKAELLLVEALRYDIDAVATEVIVRGNGKEYGITWQNSKGECQPERISECTFHDGRMDTYIDGVYCAYEERLLSFRKEEYFYSDMGLHIAHMYHFLQGSRHFLEDFEEIGPSLIHQEYRFKHDDEGYLSEYAVICHPGSSIRTKPVWDGQVYSIKIKRKA